jgi:hypothetical protein
MRHRDRFKFVLPRCHVRAGQLRENGAGARRRTPACPIDTTARASGASCSRPSGARRAPPALPRYVRSD